MITREIKNNVDKIWETFWTGGITNPLTVIEQLTYLLFMKWIDEIEKTKEQEADILGLDYEGLLPKNKQHLRWHHLMQLESPEEMYAVVSKEVFPALNELNGTDGLVFSKYMGNAIFMIPTANMLAKVVEIIDNIPMKDSDTLGDLYEYILSKLSTGTSGQFNTPRHIINMIVDLMNPTPKDSIIDPAMGSAGFLIGSSDYIRDHHGDMFFEQDFVDHFNNTMFYGNDIDCTMLSIGAMNMMLHGVSNQNIEYCDSLSEMNKDIEKYTLVLSAPPFGGLLDYKVVSNDLLKIVKTKKTELLFLLLFIRLLKKGGRAAVIVPSGVLFGKTNAHKQIRKEIIENHKLEAIISMPSGIFKPYSGVTTAVMIFTKTGVGGTKNVWFFEMTADGYSLGSKRNPIGENDIPEIIARFSNLEAEKKRKRTEQSFLVSVEELRNNEYDLSINKYKKIEYEELEYDSPKLILDRIQELEEDIIQGIIDLKKILND
ncbi:type I restriction-modification system subunit M [Lysinibacillus xylanilyticus]|uniref:site-specific DNA-methyltransferase (adenine-specific) n=1 Tax=Lysinibacillus xylanilyticus TaxID=582475 RepID=A0ABT4EN34_9BACI|nr:class I SAM-dependent DNA methyltransferase [Lysinibacillus xylanilyticus]MCY9547031.1 type I restriction-modification system subunit M [Lysinibacillus xylanilyticus]